MTPIFHLTKPPDQTKVKQMNTTLKRQSPNSFPHPDHDPDLASKAATLLKYRRMQEDLTNNKVTNKFLQFLKEQDIMPFTNESVVEYKEKAIHEADKTRLQRIERYVYRNPAFAALSIVLAFGSLISIPMSFSMSSWPLALMMTAFVSLPIFCVGAWLFVKIDGRAPTEYLWSHEHLDSYPLPIPEYVLETAVRIREKFPASFTICSLKERRETLPLDPFLVCHYVSQAYYLEVWNEPGYKQTREV